MALAFAAAVLLSIPPWIDYFATGLGEHWDTRLMGQWLAWNAHSIARGNFLIPDFNANFFYPHAYSLAFSEALWPQSFVYAAFKAAGANHFFSFNATMLVFWVLSGFCMYALLRHFKVTVLSSFFAGMIFCLMPYRLAYYIEFNMTLVFCVPLIWLAYFRWMQRPSLATTAVVAIVLWICLSSCIYYTLIAMLPLVFMFVAEIKDQPGRLRQPEFLLWLAVVVGAVVLESGLLLQPYLELSSSDYVRDASDHARHYLQPVHYINPASPLIHYNALGLDIKAIPVRLSEVLAFPGSVLCFLTLLYFIDRISSRASHGLGVGLQSISLSLQWLRCLAWGVFFSAVIVFWLTDAEHHVDPAGWTWVSAMIVLATSAYILFFPAHTDGDSRRITRLGATAIFCFFISLGANFTLGHDDRSTLLSSNPLSFLFETVKLFDALRGLSRFSIVVFCFLIVAGIWTFEKSVSSRRAKVLVVIFLIGVMIYEGRQGFYRFTDESANLASKTIQTIDALDPRIPLVQLPLGVRDSDAEAVMMTVTVLRPLVNGHSGFAPAYYQDWNEAMRQWKIEDVAEQLRNIWPTPWLVLNHRAINFLSRGWRAEFPIEIIERHWQQTENDEYRTLYRPIERPHAQRRIDRLVRRDVLVQMPYFSFEASTQGCEDCNEPPQYRVSVNDVEVARAPLRPGRHRYQTDLGSAAPTVAGDLTGDRVTLELLSANGWQVRDLSFNKSDAID